MKSKMMKIFGVASFVIASLNACSGENGVNGQAGGNMGSDNVSYGTLMDERDGQTYRITKIGNQVWMAENLNFLNKEHSYCYDNNPANCETYGRLYTEHALYDYPEVCPSGWHLPSKLEFEALLVIVGVKSRNLEASSWFGTDPYGFSALPAGFYDSEDKDRPFFRGLGGEAEFWSSSLGEGSRNYYLQVNSNGAYFELDDRGGSDNFGRSVRCLKD